MTAVAALHWLAAFLGLAALTFLAFAALVWGCLVAALRGAAESVEQ